MMLKLLCAYLPCYHRSIWGKLAPCVCGLREPYYALSPGNFARGLSSLILTGQVHSLALANQKRRFVENSGVSRQVLGELPHGQSSGCSLGYLEENLGEILNYLPTWQGGERNHCNLDINDMFSGLWGNTHSI